MSTFKEKLKHKALPYVIAGISIFGGVTQAEAQNQENTILSSIHDTSLSYNDGYCSYTESISVRHDDKTFFWKNAVMSYEIGNGYQIMHETHGDNKGNDFSTTMLSHDGREIDINFFNTGDFLVPPQYLLDPESSEKDPTKIKENNDRWEMEMCKKADKKIDNLADREAFYTYVKETRNMLETGTFNENLLKARHVKAEIKNYSVSATGPKADKSLAKEFRQIKRAMKKEIKGNSSEFKKLVVNDAKQQNQTQNDKDKLMILSGRKSSNNYQPTVNKTTLDRSKISRVSQHS